MTQVIAMLGSVVLQAGLEKILGKFEGDGNQKRSGGARTEHQRSEQRKSDSSTRSSVSHALPVLSHHV
jgi:hypothetical protein